MKNERWFWGIALLVVSVFAFWAVFFRTTSSTEIAAANSTLTPTAEVSVTPSNTVTPQQEEALEAGAPRAWTSSVCSGDAAIVFQSKDESGDGVTVSALSKAGCRERPDWGLLVVEPWGRSVNPDRACLARSWAEVGQLTIRLNTPNGSVWYLPLKKVSDNPVVVFCQAVNNVGDFGLNQFEGQVELDRAQSLVNRYKQLTSLSVEEYAKKYVGGLGILLLELKERGYNLK